MSQEDVLDRLRRLDPNVRFHDDDEPYEAQAIMHRVLALPHALKRGHRLLSVPRVAAIAAAALAVVLVLPALAVGTNPFHLLGTEPQETTPVNGLLVAKGADALKGTDDMDHPVWSPDGRLLAADRTENGVTSVYTMWPNGTHAQLLMKDASSPAWSDDGTRLFVQRDTCTAPDGCESSDEDTISVYSVAIDGRTDPRLVSDDDYDVNQPGWPPGQNVLAFLGGESAQGAQDGPTELNSLDATWSPDDTQLAVADAPTGLWAIDGDGTPRLLAKGAFSSLSWGVQVMEQAERSARR